MMAYISRLSIFKKALSKNYDIIFTERSIYTDKNVFANMLYKEKINDIEWQIYNMWFDEFSECLKNIKTVHIRTSPEICNKRVKKDQEVVKIFQLNIYRIVIIIMIVG